jgi:solute carrier family 25 citrate transporter 1
MINVQLNLIIKDFFMVFVTSYEQKVVIDNLLLIPRKSFLILGLRGTYQGLTATMLKQGSNQAIRFFVMESLKEQYRKYKLKGPNDPVPVLITGVFGLIAGAASVFGNTPLDVVKTRMQSLEASKYKSTLDCAIKIMRNEGPLA